MAYKLSNKQFQLLRNYLMNHEDDIANGINDFGDLYDLFKFAMGRPAEHGGYGYESQP